MMRPGLGRHHQNAIRQRYRFLQIMGDEKGGFPPLGQHAGKIPLQHEFRHGIEGGEGLIQQQHVRIMRQRARHRRPLTHAAEI